MFHLLAILVYKPRSDELTKGRVVILFFDQFKTDIHPTPSFETLEAIFAHNDIGKITTMLSALHG